MSVLRTDSTRTLMEPCFESTPIGKLLLESFASPATEASTSTRDTITTLAKNSLFAGVAVAARSIYYALPLELFPGQPGIAHTCAVGATIAWAGLIYKSFSTFESSRIALLALADPSRKTSYWREVAKVVVSLVGGCLASVPIFTVAYTDNGNSIPYFILSLPNGILATLSLYKSFNHIERNSHLTPEDKEVQTQIACVISKLNRFQTVLARRDTPPALLSEYDILADSKQARETKAHALRSFLETATQLSPTPAQEERSLSHKALYQSTLCLGILLSLTQLCWIGYLSFQGWSLLTNNDKISLFLGILASLINLYYSQELMRMVMTTGVVPTVESLISCRRVRSLAEQHYPLQTLALKVFLVVCSLLSFAIPTRITQEVPYPWNTISAALYSTQVMLAPVIALTGSADNIVSYFGRRSANLETARLFNMHDKVSKVIHALSHAGPKACHDYEKFMKAQENLTTGSSV